MNIVRNILIIKLFFMYHAAKTFIQSFDDSGELPNLIIIFYTKVVQCLLMFQNQILFSYSKCCKLQPSHAASSRLYIADNNIK